MPRRNVGVGHFRWTDPTLEAAERRVQQQGAELAELRRELRAAGDRERAAAREAGPAKARVKALEAKCRALEDKAKSILAKSKEAQNQLKGKAQLASKAQKKTKKLTEVRRAVLPPLAPPSDCFPHRQASALPYLPRGIGLRGVAAAAIPAATGDAVDAARAAPRPPAVPGRRGDRSYRGHRTGVVGTTL